MVLLLALATPTQNVESHSRSAVSALIASNASLNISNDIGQTALHLAAMHNHGQYVQQLLDAGADLNLPDKWGQSPLHIAVGALAKDAFLVCSLNWFLSTQTEVCILWF